MKANIPVVLIGAVVVVIGFAGNFLFGQVVNPPTTPIMVALVEIPAGARLTREMLGVDDARLNRQVIAGLVQEGELGQFLGGTVIEPVHAYQPVPKAALVVEGNPAAAGRIALALSDPDLVAMVVPVTRETSPAKVAPGDYVDLNFGVGSATFLAGSLSSAPTPQPFQPVPGFYVTLPAPPGTPEPTATAEPNITLPVAKTIVENARVLSVIYDEAPNPAYAGPNSSEPATIQGEIVALVVTVPREAQELVHFGIVNGSIRVALLSPNADVAQDRRPTLGMSWDDLVAIFRLDRERAFAEGQPAELVGPGAAAVLATLEAAEAQAERLAVTQTPTPTLAATATGQAP